LKEIAMFVPHSMAKAVWLAVLALAACTDGQPESAPPSAASAPTAADLPSASTLSALERAGLLYMREEEKLAHDVYALSLVRWGAQVFANITDSESAHMAAMLRLLETYGVADPARDRPVGSFEDAKLQALFDTLAARSKLTLVEALIVGAEIEEIDLIDIVQRRNEADNADIVRTYENLIDGSKNHLRAFVKVLATMSITYAPRHLGVDEYLKIING
jgi:hypothetical protein